MTTISQITRSCRNARYARLDTNDCTFMACHSGHNGATAETLHAGWTGSCSCCTHRWTVFSLLSKLVMCANTGQDQVTPMREIPADITAAQITDRQGLGMTSGVTGLIETLTGLQQGQAAVKMQATGQTGSKKSRPSRASLCQQHKGLPRLRKRGLF